MGGMGEVYVCLEEEGIVPVALKTAASDLRADDPLY
jgi:hypothetical protein